MRVLLALPLLFIASPLAAQTSTSAPPGSATTHSAIAMEFAREYMPDDLISISVIRAEESFLKAAKIYPKLIQLEADYPGITQAAAKSAGVAVQNIYGRWHPGMHIKLAQFFGSRMSDADLRNLTAFYRSPLGQRIRVITLQNMDSDVIINRILETGEFALAPEDALRITNPAKVMAQMTPAEHQEFSNFIATPTGQNLVKLAPDLVPFMTAESNIVGVEVLNGMSTNIQRTIEEYKKAKK